MDTITVSVNFLFVTMVELQRSKVSDYLENRVNKILEGSGCAPVTVRMLYHGAKEFNVTDKLVKKRYVFVQYIQKLFWSLEEILKCFYTCITALFTWHLRFFWIFSLRCTDMMTMPRHSLIITRPFFASKRLIMSTCAFGECIFTSMGRIVLNQIRIAYTLRIWTVWNSFNHHRMFFD